MYCLLPVSLLAQDNIPMRGSARDGYSRVVLKWPTQVSYTVDRAQKDQLKITFSRASAVDLSGFDKDALVNIRDVKVISESPLILSFSIPSSSEVRDLKIGKKFILDVYDSKEGEDTPSKVTKVKQVKEKPVEDKSTKSKKSVKPDPGDRAKKDMPASPPAIVLVPEHLPERPYPDKEEENSDTHKAQKKPHKKETKHAKPKGLNHDDLRKNVEQKHHIISLRSTQAVDVAVFEYYGDLWFVMDGRSPYLVPSLSSPTPHIFSSLTQVGVDDGTAYKMSLPDTKLRMKGMDGGLLWTLVMGQDVKPEKPVMPSYVHGDHGDMKLVWPLEQVGKILDVVDPVTGQLLKVVTVEDAGQFGGDAQSFIEFDVMPSPIGLTIVPKVDDLEVHKTSRGVEIYRKASALSLASGSDTDTARLYMKQKAGSSHGQKDPAKHGNAHTGHSEGHGKDDGHSSIKKDDHNALFKFNQWQLGSSQDVGHNENTLLSGLHEKSPARKIEDLLALGRMFLSHGYGAEALGYFQYANLELPGLDGSAEFRAIRGVANALDWKSEAALDDFLHKDLKEQDEVKYWKSFVLADLGDWKQAADILPDHYKPLYNYPDNIGNRLALVLAEVNLRDGDIKSADELIAMVEHRSAHLPDPFRAYLKYLKGEAYRQKKNEKKTEKVWKVLTDDVDDLYRTKAGLALTILLMNQKKIDTEEAVDRLERLRYAWRGDELEAQVNYWLGNAYFKRKDYVKGLGLMRDAASIAGDGVLARRITSDMTQTFTDLYLKDDLKGVSPLDAVALYEQFSELTPVGPIGDKLVQVLAEKLVNADLLDRATDLLKYQVDHRLSGDDKVRIAIRLAAIHLIDKSPQDAMDALGKAHLTADGLADLDKRKKYRQEIELLKIRAYSQNKEFDKALQLAGSVPESMHVHRLRADIAWQAGYWDDAADSLNTVLIDQHIGRDDTITRDQADIILNRAIALSLDGDRVALMNMRSKYLEQMKVSKYKANQFEVITRPSGTSTLASRETLLSAVSEVDLFKDFLDSYRKGDQ